MRRSPARGEMSSVRMDEDTRHLRRLAVHDGALLEGIVMGGSSFALSPASLQHTVALGYDVDAALEVRDP
jgi:hypothetical protein